jgi:hypothetical protein
MMEFMTASPLRTGSYVCIILTLERSDGHAIALPILRYLFESNQLIVFLGDLP